MFSSSILTALWSYLSLSEKIIVILAIVFMVHGMCVSIFWFLEPHTQRVSKLYTDIKWSLEQLWKPLAWMRRICGARMPAFAMPAPPLAMPAPPLAMPGPPLAMPAWPPQVAPRAQAGARARSPYRSR
jgi:hypothetical protein